MQKIVHSIPHRLTSVVRQPMHFMQLTQNTTQVIAYKNSNGNI